jgi:hypothetical protein
MAFHPFDCFPQGVSLGGVIHAYAGAIQRIGTYFAQ